MILQSLLYLKRAGQIFWYYLNLHDWFLAMYSAVLSPLNLYEEEDIFLFLFMIALFQFCSIYFYHCCCLAFLIFIYFG